MDNSGIYSAVYSGVHVFEMVVNDVAVMRRRHDSYLNATQILKVAGIDKGKRTKILEKEILTGEHEKVQGGYGKYQGTWVPFARGVQFCADYGVKESLRPLLELDTSNTANGTPTKEQAMAAARRGVRSGYSPYADGASAARTALAPDTSLHKRKRARLHEDPSKSFMTELFMHEDLHSAEHVLRYLDSNSAISLDVHIDQVGHTALHWAAALARVPIADALVRRGASPVARNAAGETPLIRAVNVTNSHEQDAFPQLLAVLSPALPLADRQERTVLHHIALTAGMHGRAAVASSYLNAIARWLLASGGLARFARDVANHRDVNGDTALNIAARVGSARLVQQLVEIGADPAIKNRAQLCAEDFGFPGLVATCARSSPPPSLPPDCSSRTIIADITRALTQLDERYQQQVAKHDVAIGSVHSQVRQVTHQLKVARSEASVLETKTSRLQEAERRRKLLAARIEEMGNGENGDIGLFIADIHTASAPRLKLLIHAYSKLVSQLKTTLTAFEDDHRAQESRLRSLVARCTNIPDEKIDTLIDELLEAVESDLPLDQDRFDRLASNLQL